MQSCAGYMRLELVCVGFDGYNQPNQGRGFADALNTAQEALHKDLLVNVKDIRTESIAQVKDLNNRHAEREGRNVQHV